MFFPGDKACLDGSTPSVSNGDSAFYLFIRFKEVFMDLLGLKMALLVRDEMLKSRLSNTNMAKEDKNFLNPNSENTHRQTKQLHINLHLL